MRIWKAVLGGTLAAGMALGVSALAAETQLKKKQSVTPPPFFFTQRTDNSVMDSIKRGQEVFREVGCVGCHPRGRTVGGTAVDVMGNRNPVPIPTLIGAADHFPRLSPAGQVITVGQMNDLCSAVFIGNDPMDPYSQKYRDLEAYVASLTPSLLKRMQDWEKGRKELLKKIAASAPAGRSNPCAAGGGNPCAPKNPCAGKNPCAPKR